MNAIALALLAGTAQTQLIYPAIEPDLEIALGALGLQARTARFDSNLLRLFRQGEFTTQLYDACYENPWRTPLFCENLRRELISHNGRPHEALGVCARMLGVQSRRSLVGNPNAQREYDAKQKGSLGIVLADWKKRGWISGSVPNLNAVPEEVQSAAALILSTVPDSLAFRRAAFNDLGDTGAVFKRLADKTSHSGQGEAFEPIRDLLEKVDLPYLINGAYDLVLAAQEAQSRIAVVPSDPEFEVKIPTVLGDIVLSGGSAKTYSGQALLIIDCGGSDTYFNLPANRSSGNPISIVIDAKGNDAYLSDKALRESPIAKWGDRKSGNLEPGPIGALLGYSVLIDRGGDDLYRSHRPSCGSAVLGVAVGIDMGGTDTVDAYLNSQGFGMAGVGIWDDVAGNDTYTAFNQVQGCGQSRGAGLLIDRAGDDAYTANDAVIDFASAQSAEHNVSMAQGAGNGRRGDYLDGHSLAGGVGFLIDVEGDDKYSCGVFGQGVGYWMGLGYLFDGGGKDAYSGQWYAQGASAHFAMGFLEDESGGDTYTAPMNMAQGAGHDFGMGALFDRGGNDTYVAPNLSLGAGNANGIGWAIDFQGNDRYSSSGLTLGSAAEAPQSTLRMRGLCLGVFLDLGGDDTFPASITWARNATRTTQIKDRGPTPAESQFGVFWDR